MSILGLCVSSAATEAAWRASKLAETGPPSPLLPATPSSPELPADLFSIPVDVVEAALLLVPSPPLPVTHHFAHLTYAREMQIPAGSLLTARLYTIPHVCILSQGEITVWGDNVAPEILTAPCSFVAPAGSRRIGYAHSDCTWTTLMPNPDSLTDPDAVMDLWTRIPVVHIGLKGVEPGEWESFPAVLQQLLAPSSIHPSIASATLEPEVVVNLSPAADPEVGLPPVTPACPEVHHP